MNKTPEGSVAPTRTSSRHRVVTGALLALVAVSLAACGGGGGGDDVASLGTEDAEAREDDGGEVSEAEQEDAMLEFTECMREHGIDMPDPGEGVAIGSSDPDVDQEAFDEANDECFYLIKDVVGDAPERDAEEEAERQDNAVAFAECMRDQGIDFPDPEFSEGGGGMRLPDGIHPEDPDFIEAQEACQPLLGIGEGEAPTPGGGPEGQSSDPGSES